MHSLSFYSLLSSLQEVDFFTDTIVETGIAPELDHSILASLETVPEETLLDEEAEALAEQWEIEMSIDLAEEEVIEPLPEGVPEFELHYTCEIKNVMFNLAQQYVRGLD